MKALGVVFALLFPAAPACGGSSLPPDPPERGASSDPAAAAPERKSQGGLGDDRAEEPISPEGPSAQTETPRPEPSGAATKPPGNTVQETRTPAVIRSVVLKNRQLVRNCYEKELKRSPRLRGKLTIRFSLDSKGHVTAAELNSERSTLRQPSLALCATNVLKQLKFPASSRGFESSVNYPFDFTPDHAR